MNDLRSKIDRAEKAFEEGDLEFLKKILPPLIEENVPEAIRINCSFFEEGMADEECDRIYVEGMFRAAELGDLKAKYQVGVFYDLGQFGINQDKIRASNIFKELSESGNPHCKWIYACELIWGQGSFPKSTDEGLRLLHEAAMSGSSEACMTIARFHDSGELGFSKDIDQRDKYRRLALKYDETTYDPFA